MKIKRMKSYSHLKLNARNFSIIACRESRKMRREAADDEELLCEREPHNDHDWYTVAVKKKGRIHVSCQVWPLRVAPFKPLDSQSHEMANWLIVAAWDLEARFLV